MRKIWSSIGKEGLKTRRYESKEYKERLKKQEDEEEHGKEILRRK